VEDISDDLYECVKCINCAFIIPKDPMFTGACPGCQLCGYIAPSFSYMERHIRRQPLWRDLGSVSDPDEYLKSINWDEKISLWLF